MIQRNLNKDSASLRMKEHNSARNMLCCSELFPTLERSMSVISFWARVNRMLRIRRIASTENRILVERSTRFGRVWTNHGTFVRLAENPGASVG